MQARLVCIFPSSFLYEKEMNTMCRQLSLPPLPLPVLAPLLWHIQFFFHIFRSTNFAQKIAKLPSTCQSHLTPGHTAGIWQIQLCFYYPRQTYYLFFFSFFFLFSFHNFNVFPTFTRWFLRMFWGDVVAISIYAHRICQQLSSAQGRMKEGRKDVYMVIDICTYVYPYLYLYPWLATVAVSANNLHICIWNLPASFCFFFVLPFFGFAQKI